MGPLINEAAANDVMAFVDDAVAKGANVVAGGARSAWTSTGCSTTTRAGRDRT